MKQVSKPGLETSMAQYGNMDVRFSLATLGAGGREASDRHTDLSRTFDRVERRGMVTSLVQLRTVPAVLHVT